MLLRKVGAPLCGGGEPQAERQAHLMRAPGMSPWHRLIRFPWAVKGVVSRHTTHRDAPRTSRTRASHSEQLAAIRERQRTAFGNIGPPGDATVALAARTIPQRLDTIEQQLGALERVLFALARAQGIDPETTG
jgi:hypothetical protein